MKTSFCFVVSIGAVAALPAGCGAPQPNAFAMPDMSQPRSSAVHATHYHRETIVYAFQGGTDGAAPGGALVIDASGAIYGTTSLGGSGNCYNGCGTAFKLTPSGSGYSESILYSFQGGSDGGSPSAGGLIMDRGGALYGTMIGGSSGCPPSCGAVYQLAPTKSGYVFHLLYQFKGGTDGYGPYGGVIRDSRGALYGATFAGGASGGGTAYKLAPARSGYKKSTLFSFSTSGEAEPVAGLLLGKHGALFGTALFSSVYELTPTSSGYAVRILHALNGPPDGSIPYAPVIAGPGGVLYGTTYEGGATSRCKTHFGCGTVYGLRPTKSGYRETVFSFRHHDGAFPLVAVLLGKDGALYGTTSGGGFETCPGREKSYGCGLAFKLEPTSSSFNETVLHKFAGGTDGAQPSSPLIADASGALYGTAAAGGGTGCQGGCGIVFKLSL
jgi:uncharacterized repeat protein (TIGR03803 family)